MIYQYKIQTLNEEQLGLLLYICNDLYQTKVKVDQETITSYKEKALAAKLLAAREHIRPEHAGKIDEIAAKLSIDLS